LAFTRSTTTPNAPFNADIALVLNVIDTDGVAFAGNPASFGAATSGNGVAFSGGKEMRFGRLRLSNALGSERLSLAVPMQTEYWNGSGFVLNAADSCTTIAAANVGLASYKQNLASGETSVGPVGAFSSGTKTMTLSAPGVGNNGSVDVVVNLAPNTTVNTCNAWSPSAPTPAGAGMSYLRGNWCGANYDRDPVARANFGIYGSQSKQFIYQRENY
jgi:MSHA biogenesis protein MshQ